ncbi:MAG: EamA family transporter [Candidatus Aenigmatarchaeota archaeon]
MNWIVLSLLALVLYGVWGFFIKLSTLHLNWKQCIIISSLGILTINILIYSFYRPEINWRLRGSKYALVAGIIVAISSIFFFLAIESGKASIVIALTGLYPIVTLVLAYLFLHEQLSLVQTIGIILALIAIVLMSV